MRRVVVKNVHCSECGGELEYCSLVTDDGREVDIVLYCVNCDYYFFLEELGVKKSELILAPYEEENDCDE